MFRTWAGTEQRVVEATKESGSALMPKPAKGFAFGNTQVFQYLVRIGVWTPK